MMKQLLIVIMMLLMVSSSPCSAITWPTFGLKEKTPSEDIAIVAAAANQALYSQAYYQAKSEDLTTEIWFWRVTFVVIAVTTISHITK